MKRVINKSNMALLWICILVLKLEFGSLFPGKSSSIVLTSASYYLINF